MSEIAGNSFCSDNRSDLKHVPGQGIGQRIGLVLGFSVWHFVPVSGAESGQPLGKCIWTLLVIAIAIALPSRTFPPWLFLSLLFCCLWFIFISLLLCFARLC